MEQNGSAKTIYGKAVSKNLSQGYAFVGRQQHIVTDTSDYFIDLVFYNYYLKCFVLIDIKRDELTDGAIGQMDMYVRMYNDLKKGRDDNPTVGIILCAENDDTVVKYRYWLK